MHHTNSLILRLITLLPISYGAFFFEKKTINFHRYKNKYTFAARTNAIICNNLVEFYTAKIAALNNLLCKKSCWFAKLKESRFSIVKFCYKMRTNKNLSRDIQGVSKPRTPAKQEKKQKLSIDGTINLRLSYDNSINEFMHESVKSITRSYKLLYNRYKELYDFKQSILSITQNY